MTFSPLRLALVTCVLLVAVASPAAASKTQESIFEDEHELLERGPAARDAALDDIAGLGADSIRTLVLWNRLAPAGTRRPRGFDAANPAAYPPEAWDPYDDLVRGAAARGLGLILSPSTPIPLWASQCKRKAKACKPDPKAFGAFVTALGRRYSGSYADENQGAGALPRVTRWSIGNEPNQPSWLSPQYERSSGLRVAVAAVRYRQLARATTSALRASGHGADQILLGETSPIGRSSAIPPVEFLSRLLCLDNRGRRLRGVEAKAYSCSRFKRLAVNGIAHHPYSRGGYFPPSEPARTATEITLSSVSRLQRLIAGGERAGRIPRRLGIYFTEYGFQTNPPDFSGVRLPQHADYINQADWIAFRNSRVKAVAQYKLIDDRQTSSFQTGLRFLDGRPKPAYDAYRLPIWVSRSGSSVRVYGQLRPAPDGSAQEVDIQVQAPGGAFESVQKVTVSSAKGHFLQTLPARPGVWRLQWNGLTSREAKVSGR